MLHGNRLQELVGVVHREGLHRASDTLGLELSGKGPLGAQGELGSKDVLVVATAPRR